MDLRISQTLAHASQVAAQRIDRRESAPVAEPDAPVIRDLGRDSFTLTGIDYVDIYNMQQNGYVEVEGNRWTVSERMAALLEKLEGEAQAQTLRSKALADAKQQATQAQEYAKRHEDDAKLMALAWRIYAKISSGGTVPAKDAQWLARYSQSLYVQAKMNAAMAQAQKKKYDSEVGEAEEEALEKRSTPSDTQDDRAEDYAYTQYHVEATLSDGALSDATIVADSGASPSTGP